MTPFSFRNLMMVAAPLALAILPGCTRDGKFQPVDMWNGSRLKPNEGITFFSDQNSSQTDPAGTVARGQERSDEPMFYGTQNGALIDYNPLMKRAKTPQIRKSIIERGQERFQIYCQPCHGLGGYGDGMIVKRGFAKPPSYHIKRLREAPEGHLYDVIYNGYGSMYSYAARVPTNDRWAIVAYIRTLQRSQNATAGDVPSGTQLKTTPQISPPIGEAKNFGPSAGGEYHGTGVGREQDPDAMTEDRSTQKGGEIQQEAPAIPQTGVQ